MAFSPSTTPYSRPGLSWFSPNGPISLALSLSLSLLLSRPSRKAAQAVSTRMKYGVRPRGCFRGLSRAALFGADENGIGVVHASVLRSLCGTYVSSHSGNSEAGYVCISIYGTNYGEDKQWTRRRVQLRGRYAAYDVCTCSNSPSVCVNE